MIQTDEFKVIIPDELNAGKAMDGYETQECCVSETLLFAGKGIFRKEYYRPTDCQEITIEKDLGGTVCKATAKNGDVIVEFNRKG